VLLAGLVHDVGRVGVSSLVWGKEGPLSRTGRVALYMDQMAIAAQLGLIPEPQATGATA
jgi:response regulator RpfG family c-di-GMP phosphodiesterase